MTGAGGFIGSHLTERLVELGAKTRAFVHYHSNGSWGWLDHSPYQEEIEVVAGDVCDRDSVTHAMRGVEIVFHLAALIPIPYSYQVPGSYVRTNIEGTLNVLQAARDLGITRLIHTSTSEVYGTVRAIPTDETHPLQAQSPYAASKIAADKLVESFSCSFGLPIVIVRPFNTFGPRQSARAVIPTIIAQCLTDGRVRLGNIYPTRDWTYVNDMVEGFVQAGESPQVIGRTIHLGSGREVQIEALVKMIGDLVDRSIVIERDPKRVRPEPSEVGRLVADLSLARTLLHWQPTVSLEEGLRLTIDWMQGHLDAYRAGAYAL